MATDADDKTTQSKFPRASLRARNKTLMITPADVKHYQVNRTKKTRYESDPAHTFNDSLLVLDATTQSTESMSIPGKDADDAPSPHEVCQSLGEGLEALSYVLESKAGEDETRAAPKDVYDVDFFNENDTESTASRPGSLKVDSGLVDARDIFATPSGIAVNNEEEFTIAARTLVTDQISCGTLLKHRLLGRSGASAASRGEDDRGQDLQVVGGIRSSVLYRAESSHEHSLQEGQPADEAREYVDWKKPGKLVGFLVSYVSAPMGRYVELREGRLLVSSGEGLSDSALVILDESVSPLHAIMRISADGTILILDQLSEHGTCIRRADGGKVESLMGDKSSLCHGDVVIFGECEYHVVVMGAAALKRDNAKKAN